MSLFAPQFTWAWPSWVVEFVSGLVTDVVALAVFGILTPLLLGRWLLPGAIPLTLAATLLSLLYESAFDANGFSWADVLEREAGILFGALLWGVR